jgi:hypothetical protein
MRSVNEVFPTPMFPATTTRCFVIKPPQKAWRSIGEPNSFVETLQNGSSKIKPRRLNEFKTQVRDASGWTNFIFGLLAFLFGLFSSAAAVKAELEEVQKVVTAAPQNSVLSDFRDTSIAGGLLTAMNTASKATKAHVRKTDVLGVTGIKRQLADLLTRLTGQPLQYFDNIESAKTGLWKSK